MEVVSVDNSTTGAISRAKLQSNHHHQQTNIRFLYRMPFLSPNQQCQSTEGKISHSMDLLNPCSPGGLSTLYVTTNSSWLPWGRVAMPLISPLMPVPHQTGLPGQEKQKENTGSVKRDTGKMWLLLCSYITVCCVCCCSCFFSICRFSLFERPFSRRTCISRCLAPVKSSPPTNQHPVLTAIFQPVPECLHSGFIGAKGDGGDRAVKFAKFQSNRHHQQINIQFYRPDDLPVVQPTVSSNFVSDH